LRPIRKLVDEILKEMSPQFAKLYSSVGRPSIAPVRLMRSLLLQILYSVRSERLLIELLQYNLLFRWFVGMEMDDTVWNHGVFSKNWERLLNEEIAAGFFRRVLAASTREAFYVGRAFYGGWDADRGLREPEELSAEGREGYPTTSRRGCRFSWRKAEERNS
jgi:hypothetical protein